MKLADLAKKLRKPTSILSGWARQGKFKTAEKVYSDHKNVWIISEDEALEVIKNTIVKY